MQILIPKRLTENTTIQQYELLTYCYLKVLTPLWEVEKYYIHIDALLYAIYKKTGTTQKNRENIYKAMQNLIDVGAISAERCGKCSYLVETQSLFVDTRKERFIVAHSEDIDAIMKADNTIRIQLVRYYIYLMRTLNADITVYDDEGNPKNNIVGHQPQSYLSYLTDISTHTIMRYNSILEKMHVIYVYRANDFILTDNGLKQITNVYGRYADKEYLIKYGNSLKEQYGSYNLTYKTKSESNTKRRLAQMYLQLCKGKTYSEDKIREIYDYIIAQNKKYRNLAESEQNKSYLENIKDETVFRQFEFLDFE